MIALVNGEKLPAPEPAHWDSPKSFDAFNPFWLFFAFVVSGILRTTLGRLIGSIATGGVVTPGVMAGSVLAPTAWKAPFCGPIRFGVVGADAGPPLLGVMLAPARAVDVVTRVPPRSTAPTTGLLILPMVMDGVPINPRSA